MSNFHCSLVNSEQTDVLTAVWFRREPTLYFTRPVATARFLLYFGFSLNSFNRLPGMSSGKNPPVLFKAKVIPLA